ncbi:hypothetical protein OESDEN_23006, partial [Oesophagostomum dentatum]
MEETERCKILCREHNINDSAVNESANAMAASQFLCTALLLQAALALDPREIEWTMLSPDGSKVQLNRDIPLFLKQMMSSMLPRTGSFGNMPQTVVQEVKEQTFVPNQPSLPVVADAQPFSTNMGTSAGLATQVEDILTPKLAPQP